MWKWWDTSKGAWGLLAIGVGGGLVLTYFSAQVGIPMGIVITSAGIILVVRAYRGKVKAKGEQQIEDDKKASLLALPDALHALGELDVRLVEELGRNKRKEASLKLMSILSRLQKDWEVKPSRTYNNLSEQARREAKDIVNQTAKKMGLSCTSVNEETMIFMLHIAGVLDDEDIGISEQREKDDRYKLVMKLQSRVATQELNNAIRIYQRYSLGINSILLFISYCPTKYAKLIMKEFGFTSTELRAEREQTLHFLLTKISELVEKELYGKNKNEA